MRGASGDRRPYRDLFPKMFGNITEQPASSEPNGFLALAEFDKPENGGNSDGVMSGADSIYETLRLWQDKNHNGVSERDELLSLSALGIVGIDLDFHESRRMDRYGNRFRYRAKVRLSQGGRVQRWAWDVFLRVELDESNLSESASSVAAK